MKRGPTAAKNTDLGPSSHGKRSKNAGLDEKEYVDKTLDVVREWSK